MIPRRILCALALIAMVVAYAKGRADNEASHTAAALKSERAAAAAMAELAAAGCECEAGRKQY